MSKINQTIADLFEIDKMPKEKADEMILRLGKLIFQSVLARVLPFLSEENMTEYEKIIASQGDGEEILRFLSEKVPNFENIVKEEAESTRKELAKEFTGAEI